MATKKQDEVIESVKQLARIYQPTNVKKFVKEYVKKYNIHGGYEDELASLVEMELNKSS